MSSQEYPPWASEPDEPESTELLVARERARKAVDALRAEYGGAELGKQQREAAMLKLAKELAQPAKDPTNA